MSLKYAILGFLSYQPMSGYDLKKRIDSTVAHFWPADQAQIYRTLGQVVEAGFATTELIEQEERPDRKLYHLTSTGEEALLHWLCEAQPPPKTREPFLLQLFFAGKLSHKEQKSLVAREIAETQHRLQIFIQMLDLYKEMNHQKLHFFALATLDSGYKAAQAYHHWLLSLQHKIENEIWSFDWET